MGLRFILGRAGTGKTRFCLDELRTVAQKEPEGAPLVLLVPEQATFQMEQALLSSGLKGMMRAQVLSFQRLAWRVSMAVGGLSQPPLSDLGKQMLLRALVERRQSELQIFEQVADRPGFIAKLAHTISELRTYKLGPADLVQQMAVITREGTGRGTLGAKLHDLSLVMQDLTDYTRDRFTDPDEYLTVLAQKLPESRLLEGATVWVDSFTGFTPQQMDVLRALLMSASQVEITLCLDPDDLAKGEHGPTDLFHPILSTYDDVSAMAEKMGVPQAPPVLLHDSARFARARDLAHLERYLFRPGLPKVWNHLSPSIALVSAQNRRQEAEAAAREVLRLARDEGMRYREIAVIVRNLDAYGDLLDTVFAEHGIPVFIDRRHTVAHHPLVELLRAALDVVIQDWAYGPVFRYLKTDLTPVYRDQVDLLENYVLEHGIRGRRWHDGEPWMFVRLYTLEEETELTPADEAMLRRINTIRNRAAAELAAFHRRLGGGRGQKLRTVRTITTALFQLLDDLKVAQRLELWSDQAEEAGDLGAAREHEQVWADVLDLLDQMVESMGDAEMGLDQYLQVLSAGLDGLRLGLIPPGLDQVVVGSVERSRHSGLRAALILGATDRDFPPLPPEDVIFNDAERDQLDASGVRMGPTSQLQLFQEQYFTYVALTRASERLWLSYPLADEDGRALSPSAVIRRVLQSFVEVNTESLGDGTGLPAAMAIATPSQLAAALTQALRIHRSGYPLDPIWLDLYQWAVSDPALRQQVAPTLAALRYEEWFRERTAPLGPQLALQLYGEHLVTSVSRLESFIACPFQHFIEYGLRLKERPQFQVSAPELGMFYHAAMSLFVRGLIQEGVGWDTLTPAEAAQRMDRVVDLLAPRLQSEILLSSPQHRYLLHVLRRTLQSSLTFLGEHVHTGGFQPLWVELPFGENLPGGLPPVEVLLEGERSVRLRGRIDRVDGYQAMDGTWFLRVIDYKSSARSLNLGSFFSGFSLQLLLYLYAVVTHSPALMQAPALPAGGLYFPIYDPIERLARPESQEQILALRRKQYRAKGIIAANPEIFTQMDPGELGLIQAKLKKDGTFYKNSLVADPVQFNLLFRRLEHLVRQSASQLLQGDVTVAPVKVAATSPCTVCRLRAVCQFDPLVAGQCYRSVKLLKSEEVWTQLEAEGGKNGE